MKKHFTLIAIFASFFVTLLLWYGSFYPERFSGLRPFVASELSSETEKDVLEYEVSDDWVVYDVGFSFSAISNIERDTNGLMWVSSGSLLRYDGKSWCDCKSKVLSPLYGSIRALGVLNNKVYVGNSGSNSDGVIGVYDINTQRWTVLSSDSGELSGAGSQWGSIAIDADGRGYFATAVDILDIYDGNNWEHIPIPVPKETGHLFYRDSLVDNRGVYWLATDDGVWEYSNGEWIVHPLPQSANAIARDSRGRMWVGTSEGIAVQDTDGKWYSYTNDHYPFADTSDLMGNAWILDIAIDSLDRVWFVTRHKLCVFNGQDWQFFEPTVVGATRWADAIAFDSAGHPWIAAQDRGVAVFRGELEIGPFTELIAPPPLEDLPEYELGPSSIVKPDTEFEIFGVADRYLSLALIVVLSGIQIIKAVRGNSNQANGKE